MFFASLNFIYFLYRQVGANVIQAKVTRVDGDNEVFVQGSENSCPEFLYLGEREKLNKTCPAIAQYERMKKKASKMPFQVKIWR